MSLAKRLAASERRERLTWDEAVADCLRRNHHDDAPPTAAELEPHRRANRNAGETASSIAFARQTGTRADDRPAPGMLF